MNLRQAKAFLDMKQKHKHKRKKINKTFVLQITPSRKQKHVPQNGRKYSQIIQPVRELCP